MKRGERRAWVLPFVVAAVGGVFAFGLDQAEAPNRLRWRLENLLPLGQSVQPLVLLLLALIAPFPLARSIVAWKQGQGVLSNRADRVAICLGAVLAVHLAAYAAAISASVEQAAGWFLTVELAALAAGMAAIARVGRMAREGGEGLAGWGSSVVEYGGVMGPLLAFGLVSAGLGQDANHDLLNYHYYNGHALVHGRMEIDLGVASYEGCFNPLLDAGAYLLSQRAAPVWFGFVLGAAHGVAFVLLMLLTAEVLAGAGVTGPLRAPLAVGCALAGTMEPIFLTQLGTWFHEDLLAALVLSGAWLVVRRLRGGAGSGLWVGSLTRAALAAGLLAGAAVGFKLTAAAGALAMGAALALAVPGVRGKSRALAAWGLGTGAGFLATNGFWMLWLYRRFGNPVFPFFNSIFRSPYWPEEDLDFLQPLSWREHLTLPLEMARLGWVVTEAGVTRDPRLAMAVVLGLAALGATAARWLWSRGQEDSLQRVGCGRASVFVLGMTTTAYLLWHVKFRVLRYLVVVKLLAPLACVLLAVMVVGAFRRRVGLAVALVPVACVVGISVPDFRHIGWDRGIAELDSPPSLGLGRAMVLMVNRLEGGGGALMSPWISRFPRGVRFAHLSTHLCVLFRQGPEGPEQLQMRKDIEEAVARHDGPLYVLTPRRADLKALKQTLSELGLEVAGPPVAEVAGPLADLTLSPLLRRVPSWIPLPGDYDGDGKAEPAIFRADLGWVRAGEGNWRSPPTTRSAVPVPADYDGDGKVDLATFDPFESRWRIAGRASFLFGQGSLHGGSPVPVPADYDGDGKADPAVFQPDTGAWALSRSTEGGLIETLGAGDASSPVLPVPADYDGDGKADPAVYRPGTGEWEVLGSREGLRTIRGLVDGTDGLIPVAADYDGDGKADPAVFEPEAGGWTILASRDGPLRRTLGGAEPGGWLPAPADYDGDGKADLARFDPSDGSWTMFCSSERVESRTQPFAVEVASPGLSARGRLAGANGSEYQSQNRAR